MALHSHTEAQKRRRRAAPGKSAGKRKASATGDDKSARGTLASGKALRANAARPKRKSARGNARPGSAGRASSNRDRPSLPNGVLASATSTTSGVGGFAPVRPRTQGRGTGGRKGTVNPQGIIRGSGGQRVPRRRVLPVPPPGNTSTIDPRLATFAGSGGRTNVAPSPAQVSGGIRDVNLGTTDQRRRRRR